MRLNGSYCILGIDKGGMEPKCDVKPAYTGVKCPQFSFARLLVNETALTAWSSALSHLGWIDRVLGLAMVALGIKVLTTRV